ncbi:MAG: catalase family protein [Geminicoccaceae bacterium]
MTKPTSRIRAIGAILAAGYLSACASDGTLQPGEEHVVDGEERTIADISNLLSTQLHRQYGDEPFLRDTHPKSNGCVKAEFRVDDDIPPEFKHGVFEKPASYKAWLRFSNSAPELTHDIEKDFRGLAIKLFDVEGERLPVPGDEQQTQDFLFIAFPAFFAGNPKDFHTFFDANFNGDRLDRSGYFLKRPRAALNTLQGRQRFGNPLEITWYSVAPFLIGRQQADGSGLAVKYRVESCTPRNVPPPEIADADEDYLRHAMERRLADGDHCLEFSLQKQGNPSGMPIEDTLTTWNEELSPFIRVAQLIVPKQTLGSPAQLEFCENLSFNPWNSLKEHQPLGGINRARRDVMKTISDLRLKQRGVERTEPTGEESFP